MAKFNEKRIPYETQVRLLNSFCEMLSKLKTKAEIYNFIKDLLNRQERLMLVRRLLIAEMLFEGKSYGEIRGELKCGNSTIAKVQRALNFGRGGYKRAVRAKKGKK